MSGIKARASYLWLQYIQHLCLISFHMNMYTAIQILSRRRLTNKIRSGRDVQAADRDQGDTKQNAQDLRLTAMANMTKDQLHDSY